MNKVSAFVKKNEQTIKRIGLATVGFVVGAIASASVGLTFKKEKPKELVCINPDYYDNFDDAVAAFKELQKTTKNAALFDSYGEAYGVFDESPVLGPIK